MSTINELKDSCKKNFEEKISSPFYGAFIISWLIWNWKVWYATFFIDSGLLLQEKSILKIDYIIKIYPWGSFWNFLYNFCHLLMLPFLSAWFLIYIFSKVTCHFYEKSLETENKNKLAKNKKDKEFLKVTSDTLDIEKNILIKQAQVKEEKNKSEKSQIEKLDEEYEVFKNSKFYNSFESVKVCIYNDNGWSENLPFQVKAYFDANNIIKNVDGSNSSKIELTEKGKYFMSKFTNEK